MNSALISAIHDHCKVRCIDLNDEAAIFDRKKNGLIGEVTLRRLLASIGFQITSEQFAKLVEEFKSEEGIRVYDFVNAVNESESASKSQFADTLSVFQELKYLKRFLNSRNATLRELLKRYDQCYRGYVSPDTFFRAVGYSTEARKIAAKYTFDRQQGVNYRKIQEDIDNMASITMKAKPDLSELSQELTQRHADVVAIMQASGGRNGMVPYNTMYSALRNFTKDADTITNFYSSMDGYCNLNDFARDITEANAVTTANITAQNVSMKKEEKPKVDPNEAMNYIKKQLSMRHVTSGSFFGEMQCCERIDNSRFANTLSSMHVGITEDDIGAITEYLTDGNTVDLQQFIKCTDFRYVREAQKLPIDDFRNYLKKTNKRIAPYAARIDREDSGEITLNEMHAIFTRVGYALPTHTIAALVSPYLDNRTSIVHWKELAADVDPPMPQPVQETAYVPERDPRETQKPKPQRGPQVSIELGKVLAKINETAKEYSIFLEDDFRLADRNHLGYLRPHVIEDIISFANLTQREKSIFFAEYGNGYYPYILEDLKECVPTEQQSGLSEELKEHLSELKGNLFLNNISVYDLLGGKFVYSQRAECILSRYTKYSAEIINALKDKKRQELVHPALIQKALDEVDMKKTNRGRKQNYVLQKQLGIIKQIAKSKRTTLPHLFADCGDFVGIEEVRRRLCRLNIGLEKNELEGIQEEFGCENGIDLKKFFNAVNESCSF